MGLGVKMFDVSRDRSLARKAVGETRPMRDRWSTDRVSLRMSL